MASLSSAFRVIRGSNSSPVPEFSGRTSDKNGKTDRCFAPNLQRLAGKDCEKIRSKGSRCCLTISHPRVTPMTHDLSQALSEHFGFAEFRAGQREVIEALLAGRSAVAVFPTGSGKSLCYQLPALLLEGLTLVVSPLIALMKDQVDALQNRGIAAQRLDSTLSGDEYRELMSELRSGRLRLLFVAPERFNNELFRETIRPLLDFAVRDRRGALHLGMGPQFPAGLFEADRVLEAMRSRADPGIDGHRHSAGFRRSAAGVRGGARRCDLHRVLSKQPDAAGHRRRRAAIAIRC